MLQGDELAAWLNSRCGKLTASRMGAAMDFLKKGGPSKARSDYMRELVAERATQASVRHYVTPAMEHGLIYEDDAKAAYEAETGRLIMPSGFYDHPTIDNFGATPDGELPGGGLIEVKCPTTTTFVEWVMAGVVPPEHVPQMTAQLLCTGRKWCEFVAYDPRVMKRPLFVRRFTPTPEQTAEVEAAAIQFLEETDTMFELFTTAAA